MQQELKELQPELIETSKETEQLIKVIADETVEVEEKKKVSSARIFRVESASKNLLPSKGRKDLFATPKYSLARVGNSISQK